MLVRTNISRGTNYFQMILVQYLKKIVRLLSSGFVLSMFLNFGQSGSIARVFMLRWDRQSLHLARENVLKLHLYFRYTDDQNHINEPLPRGTRWDGEKLSVVPEELEADKETPTDKMTMRELRKMSNSISPIIELEEDTPSHHGNKKLHILDLNVRIERNDENDTTSEKVRYQF